MKPQSARARSVTSLNPVTRGRTGGRTSDRVYDELVSAIRDLRIPPGASLSETELAEQLRVSRTPLREAIARLVDNGLVSVVPQVGTRVDLISMGDVEQARFVREHLEVAAFASACALRVRDVAALRSILAEQELAHERGDIDAFFAADERLHEGIFELSGYPRAWRAMQSLKLQLDRLRRLSLPDTARVRELIDEHVAIVDALESGQARAGTALVSKHARRVSEYGPGLRSDHPELFRA